MSKKLICMLLACLMILSLSACGKQTEQPAELVVEGNGGERRSRLHPLGNLRPQRARQGKQRMGCARRHAVPLRLHGRSPDRLL